MIFTSLSYRENMLSQFVQMLIHEHGIILKMCDALEDLDKQNLHDENTLIDLLSDAIHFFEQYGDSFHHEKEEKILFIQLRENPEFMLESLIAELEEQHQEFRKHLVTVRLSLQKNNISEALKIFKEYTKSLKEHIAAENEELFMAAETIFSDREKERIYYQFCDSDNDLGEDLKQELEKMML